MWDVKFDTSTKIGTMYLFYLDYVGCKVDEYARRKNNGELSFISTMWDVKMIQKVERES